jgi:hypothetical protein
MSEMTASREMTLAEWMATLPAKHGANKEYQDLLRRAEPTPESQGGFMRAGPTDAGREADFDAKVQAVAKARELAGEVPPPEPTQEPVGYIEEDEVPVMGRATLHSTPNPSRVPLFAAPQDTRTVAEIRQAVEEVKTDGGQSFGIALYEAGVMDALDAILARLGLEEENHG